MAGPCYELLVVGHVTRDLVRHAKLPGVPHDATLAELEPAQERLGGAAAYAALAAAELGLKTQLLTAACPELPLLRALAHERIDLFVQPSSRVTTFAIDSRGPRRHLRVTEQAEPLTEDTLARASARLAYVGPVLAELDLGSLRQLDLERLVIGVQGWLRRLDVDGTVLSHTPDWLGALPAAADLVFSEQDHPEAEHLADVLSATGRVVIVTRGAAGVSVWRSGKRREFGAVGALEVDATGAGDVFGALYTILRGRRASVETAIERALLGAARSVEGPGLGRLNECATDILAGTDRTIAPDAGD